MSAGTEAPARHAPSGPAGLASGTVALRSRGLRSRVAISVPAARIPPGLLVAGLYLLATCAFRFQAVLHPNAVCACDGGVDATQFVWALEWWPYALLHGLNPIVTHVIYAPGGMNLAAGTSIPGAALAAAPLTAVAGPVVAYNLLSLLAPVLGAWLAYRLCLYVTRSQLASAVGGYLYGFSSYGLAQTAGHLHLAFTFCAPAAALLTLKRLDGRITARRYVALLALVLVFQLLVSSEMALTLCLVGAVALVCGWFAAEPSRREQIVRLLVPIGSAFVLTLIVCSPYLYYELFRGSAYSAGWGNYYAADLLNFVVPTPITAVGGHSFASLAGTFSSSDYGESTAYLGIAQVALVAAFFFRWRRSRTTRFLLPLLMIVFIWSLGDRLLVGGRSVLPLPWSLYGGLPVVDQLLPVRVTVYIALVSAVVVACWLAAPARRRWGRWILAAVAIALVVPSAGATYPQTHQSVYHGRFEEPAFFTAGTYRHYLRRNEVVLPIPFGSAGQSLLWQARTGLYFRLASGYFGAVPRGFAPVRVGLELEQTAGRLPPSIGRDIRQFVAVHNVGAIVVAADASRLWAPVLTADGLRRVTVGGVELYRVPAGWRRRQPSPS